MLDSATTRSRFDQLGHAIFLGCSWTWCIGMFLPILLWRDFGPWALAVFAIPNIVGAAAMGAVLSSPDQARWILRHHAAAIGVFRVSTVLFHYVFAFWLAHSMGVPQTQLIFGAVAFVLLTELFRSALRLSQASASLVVWLTSLAVGVILAVSGNIGPVPEGPPALPIGHLLPLALVCMLGFLLCPYLDPTFLVVRAQIEHPADARRTFALGFGVIFASMVALTAGYAWLFGPSASPAALRNAAPIAGAAVLIHLLVQAVFTIAAHNATRDQLPERRDWASTLRIVGIMLGAGLALGLAATSTLPAAGNSAAARSASSGRGVQTRLRPSRPHGNSKYRLGGKRSCAVPVSASRPRPAPSRVRSRATTTGTSLPPRSWISSSSEEPPALVERSMGSRWRNWQSARSVIRSATQASRQDPISSGTVLVGVGVCAVAALARKRVAIVRAWRIMARR
ncbi:hypothetical protein J4558_04010 [Leptolyngbya sp. 15MV]|nr:hypothetical protein J4558_04010 [Leptolyngbya sp. 15MV]